MGSFRPDAGGPAALWDRSSTAAGVVLTPALPPGAEREAVLEGFKAELCGRAALVDEAVTELMGLVATHEPIEFLSAVAVPTSMGLNTRGSRDDDAGETVTWPAKVEYLVGLALAAPPGAGPTQTDVTRRAMSLVDDIFDGVRAKQMLDSFDAPHVENDGLAGAMFMLRQEQVFDRMPGYARHLEEIDSEVFNRHRDYYSDALGFSPGDVARVVRTRIAADGLRVNEALRRAQKYVKQDRERSFIAMHEMLTLVDASRRWTADLLAADTGADPAELAAMLDFFSVEFGSQPAFRLPTDPNVVRTRPVVAMGDGTYFIADPWALLAAVHPRMAAAATDPRPMERYRTHREQGHQCLVADTMRTIFGPDLVFEQQHYDSAINGHGEVDVLVTTDLPLIVEAKAHALTDSGRRGAPLRVKRVAGDVIESALEQIARARCYILDEERRDFADREGGPENRRLTGSISDIAEIVVTFERMDPLAMHGPRLVGRDDRSAWIVCLADLLMIRDILADAGSFHHYGRVRAGMATAGPLVFMESDALGSYLVDRIAPQRDAVADDPDTIVMIGYGSGAINEYFTALELGRDAKPPSTGVPRSVAAALTAVASNSGCWTRIVDAVMQADDATWKRWKSFSRRHKQARFHLTDGVSVGLGPVALRCMDGVYELDVSDRR